ncbi:cation transporter [uncultured Clostridium sp.]|uniref:cation transporter n=1 Tax=uncultured Clostridium sp. TaxID=59620 RepID=UPI0025E9EEC6|nr:cation transporter [uncultured Clostridium sp.]
MYKEHYFVNELTNSNMKTEVKNVLKDIDGVNQVWVNSTNETVEVIYNEPATEAEIINCIESTDHSME